MPTSTLHSVNSLTRSRSATSLSRKSARHNRHAVLIPAKPGARKRLTSPSPNPRLRRHSNAVPHRRATSPSPVRGRVGVQRIRRQSPSPAYGRDARLRRQSPLARSHSTGSLARSASLHRSTTSASSIASKRAQKKARAVALRRLARSKSANSIARKKIAAAGNANSISSARTRSQYHIQPMALGGETTTGPIKPRPVGGGVAGLFRRKNTGADKHAALRGLFGKKSPTPAIAIAPTPGVPKRPAPTVAGLEKALVPRTPQTMALVPRTVASRGAASQPLVQHRAGRPPTLAERKRAMALASRTRGNARQLRTVRYGTSGPNGSMMIRRAVMASGGVRVGPSPSAFPGVNGGTSKGSMGLRSVLLDGDDIGSYGVMMPLGFEAVKGALMFYKMRGVEVMAIADEMTIAEWEEASSADAMDAIGQLRAAGMLLVPPLGSSYNRFLLKIADEFGMDIVSNNQFELEQTLEQEPMDFLETKLIPFMIVKDQFIPHPEEGRILSGLHGPRPPDPMLMGTGSGSMGAIGPIPGNGKSNGAIVGLPRGVKAGPGGGAKQAMKMRSAQRVAAARVAATARNRQMYQSRMRTVTQQQQMAQRRRKLAQMQKMQQQQPAMLQLTR